LQIGITSVQSNKYDHVASDASGVLTGEGTWTTSDFSSSSLALALPTTLRALPSEEVYRVNVLWTLSTGP
jgi:hypothetical protein